VKYLVAKTHDNFLNVKERWKQVKYIKYLGLSKSGEIIFRTESATIKGRFYIEKIKLVHLGELRKYGKKNKKTLRDRVKNDDVGIWCSCPAHLYWGYKYIGWKGGWGLRKETRKPKIRNPQQRGALCKHMLAIFSRWDSYLDSITRDLQKGRWFDDEVEEDSKNYIQNTGT
jgi:hypothetical protein